MLPATETDALRIWFVNPKRSDSGNDDVSYIRPSSTPSGVSDQLEFHPGLNRTNLSAIVVLIPNPRSLLPGLYVLYGLGQVGEGGFGVSVEHGGAGFEKERVFET